MCVCVRLMRDKLVGVLLLDMLESYSLNWHAYTICTWVCWSWGTRMNFVCFPFRWAQVLTPTRCLWFLQGIWWKMRLSSARSPGTPGPGNSFVSFPSDIGASWKFFCPNSYFLLVFSQFVRQHQCSVCHTLVRFCWPWYYQRSVRGPNFAAPPNQLLGCAA